MATLAELITQIQSTIFPNTTKLIDAQDHQDLLVAIVNAVYPVPDESTGIPTWTSSEDILTGTYWLYNDKIWVSLDDSGPSYGGAVEPGTNAAYWLEIPASALTHAQNTDFKLGRWVSLLDGGGTQTFDLTDSLYNEYNYFILESDAGGSDATYTLQTVNGTARKRGMFFCVVQSASTFTITFEDNATQLIGGTNLELTGGDWALFEGDINGKTTLLMSNKMAGAGGAGGGHVLQEPDGTPLSQRDNLRATSPLRFSNPIGELYSELDIDPDETLEEDYADLTANTVALTGTGSVLTATTFDTGAALTADELVDDILIVTHSSLTEYNPTPKEAFRVVSNTAAGVITIEGTFVYTTAGAAFDVLTPYEIFANKDFLLACKPSGNDLAVQFPLVAAATNRNKIEIYWEEGFTPSDNRVFMFTKTGQKIKNSEKASLLAENESYYFRHHAAGTFHFDFLQASFVNSILDVNITTPYATAINTASALVPVPATVWNTGTPIRWTCETVADPTYASQFNIEATYTCLLERYAEIVGYIEVQRGVGGTRTVELAIQKYNGATWDTVTGSLRSLILTDSGSRNDLSVSARVLLETNDIYRIAFSSNDTVSVTKAGINMIKTQ